MQLISPIIWFA